MVARTKVRNKRPPPRAQKAPDPHPQLEQAPLDLNTQLPTAWRHWAAQTLGGLEQLPKLTQSQLSAIAGAAAGIGANPPSNVDLPASLAALFEAKLTLDREKAKLLQMQNELKGYRQSGKGKEVDCGHHHHEEEEEFCDHCEDDCDCSCHSYDYDEAEKDRLEQAVQELFEWVKAVVWMFEQRLKQNDAG